MHKAQCFCENKSRTVFMELIWQHEYTIFWESLQHKIKKSPHREGRGGKLSFVVFDAGKIFSVTGKFEFYVIPVTALLVLKGDG